MLTIFHIKSSLLPTMLCPHAMPPKGYGMVTNSAHFYASDLHSNKYSSRQSLPAIATACGMHFSLQNIASCANLMMGNTRSSKLG